MDEFGVLVESMGFRANGRSTPMANMKPKSHPRTSAAAASSFHESNSFSVDELDGIFRSNHNIDKTTQQSQNFDDVSGSPITSGNQYSWVDLDSVFRGSNSRNSDACDDLLGLGSSHGDHVDDSFGSFVKISVVKEAEKRGLEVDALLPGFGGNVRENTRVSSGNDPSSVFESSGSQSDSFWPFNGSLKKDVEKGPSKGSFDDLLGLNLHGISTTANNSSSETSLNESKDVSYLVDFFSGKGMEPEKSAKPSSSSQESLFDDLFHEEKNPERRGTSKPPSSAKMATFPRREPNDFSFLFGDITTSSGEFNEIEGEPEERRRTRLNRHIRTNERMAEALAEKNQRDLQSQWEQEEKRRIAETLEHDIKRWAAGKEGNLRALLSSLQEVLWPECSWRPVPLTDMITSESVKKVYKKAALFVHPDKVQQKGANLQRKYIAEKVFDILKEAWNKFSVDELSR